jgi:TolB-like protein/Tfp pilus assembly protein PilF/predicted metal-dependent HD superfamily phosphohydrolase
MSSLIQGNENDIFISYRHNDNRSGWVTEFVRHLNEELASTIKDPVSVYFDSNPYDGLLETHDVDKSLEGKLKSLIFIPVLSQTYCDTKSFAWQHEYLAFNTLAKQDSLGRDIKLSNGNVTSRILPIKIHDLDSEDKSLLENEIGGTLRSIDFIYKEPGVNRPLKITDNRGDNQNKTDYKNQVNKVANAVKEIIYAIKFPNKRHESVSSIHESDILTRKEETLADRSIAVLPFSNLSPDPSQEYFSDGITENIICELAALSSLRVISRTSVIRYKKTILSAPEIARELKVKYLLQGSAQMHGNKVRINVQLIEGAEDQHLWSKIFMESIDDIFMIQGTVAEKVAAEMKAKLNPEEEKKLGEVVTKDIVAYDLFLKGRHAYNQWTADGYKLALSYFEKAIEKDPEFQLAYSYVASCYSARMSWNGDLDPKTALNKIKKYLDESWKRGPLDNDYLTKGFVEFFINKNFDNAEVMFRETIRMNPNNALAYYTFGYLLFMKKDFDKAVSTIKEAQKLEPNTVAYFNYQALTHYLFRRYDEATETLLEAIKLFPQVVRFKDHLCRTFISMENYQGVLSVAERELKTVRPPSMVAYAAIAYAKLHRHDEANRLLEELIHRSAAEEKGVNIYIVHFYARQENRTEASAWLSKSELTNDVDLIWRDVDPLLQPLRERIRPVIDFHRAENMIISRLESQLPASLNYHNINHTKDVLKAAMEIAVNENISSHETSLLRLAVLFHDAGLIYSATDHEEKGAQMAAEMLSGFQLTDGDIDCIQGIIRATRIPQTPSTLLQKIICDADLDYLGRDDFEEISKRLFYELSFYGVVTDQKQWDGIQKAFLENHQYHLDFQKARRDEKKQRHLKVITQRVTISLN